MAIKGSFITNNKNLTEKVNILSPDKSEDLAIYLADIIKKEQQLPWDNPVHQNISFIQYNPITGTVYKGGNIMRLYLSSLKNGFTDPRWVTFNSIANNKDYKLKNNSKSTLIEFHKNLKYGTDEWNKYVSNLQEKTKQEHLLNKKDILIHTYHTVFNAEQFEKFPSLEKKPQLVIPEEDRIKAIEEIITNSKAPIIYDGRGKNYYDQLTNTIHLTKQEHFKSKEAFYSTALHEIINSIDYKSYLNTNVTKELVSEFSAILLRERYNVTKTKEQVQNSLSYIQSWAEDIKYDPNIIYKSMNKAERLFNIMESRMLINQKSNTFTNQINELLKKNDEQVKQLRTPIHIATPIEFNKQPLNKKINHSKSKERTIYYENNR
jgi:antirestriction protein ArdC